MNLANLITIFRIILIPIYLFFFYSNYKNKLLLSGLVFILAGISDVLDGHIARKYDMSTRLGTILDPLADKLMMLSVLVSFTHIGIIPSWIIVLMGIKELMMVAGGAILYLFNKKAVVPSNIFGKLATFLFYGATIFTMLGISKEWTIYLYGLTVFANIVAFINYLIIFLKIGRP